MSDKCLKEERAPDQNPFDLVIDFIFASRDDQAVPDLARAMDIYNEAQKPRNAHGAGKV